MMNLRIEYENGSWYTIEVECYWQPTLSTHQYIGLSYDPERREYRYQTKYNIIDYDRSEERKSILRISHPFYSPENTKLYVGEKDVTESTHMGRYYDYEKKEFTTEIPFIFNGFDMKEDTGLKQIKIAGQKFMANPFFFQTCPNRKNIEDIIFEDNSTQTISTLYPDSCRNMEKCKFTGFNFDLDEYFSAMFFNCRNLIRPVTINIDTAGTIVWLGNPYNRDQVIGIDATTFYNCPAPVIFRETKET